MGLKAASSCRLAMHDGLGNSSLSHQSGKGIERSMNRLKLSAWTGLAILAVGAALSTTALTPAIAGSDLIPRSAIFGNPERSGAQVSPDGRWLSFLAPRDLRLALRCLRR